MSNPPQPFSSTAFCMPAMVGACSGSMRLAPSCASASFFKFHNFSAGPAHLGCLKLSFPSAARWHSRQCCNSWRTFSLIFEFVNTLLQSIYLTGAITVPVSGRALASSVFSVRRLTAFVIAFRHLILVDLLVAGTVAVFVIPHFALTSAMAVSAHFRCRSFFFLYDALAG